MMKRGEILVFAAWFKAHKQDPEALAPLPGGPDDVELTVPEARALIAEYKEWFSVAPDYAVKLTELYTHWRAQAIAVMEYGGDE